MISSIIGILLIRMAISYSSKKYHLTSGIPKSLFNLKENTGLSFYIRATVYQKAITTITLNNDVSSSNFIITFCSYKSLNSNCISKINKILNFKQKGNQLFGTYEYSVSNNDTNYIGAHFSTNKNISYLSIRINVGGKAYDLSPGLPKNIKSLLPSFPYTFRLPVKEYQRKVNVTFTIINDTEKPFDYVYINENHREKGRSPSSTTHKIANVSPKNNQLDLSFYHNILHIDINYINVVVIPKKKISNLKIKIDLDYFFDLNFVYNSDEIYFKNLTNLKSKINYYLNIRLKYLQHANITLSMNKMASQPFNNISISYYEDYSYAYPKKYSNQIVSFEEVNNKLVTNLTIDNNNDSIQFIILNFIPLYNIEYIDTILKIGEAPY